MGVAKISGKLAHAMGVSRCTKGQEAQASKVARVADHPEIGYDVWQRRHAGLASMAIDVDKVLFNKIINNNDFIWPFKREL